MAVFTDWRPDIQSDFGPATLTNGPRSTDWLTVGVDGHFYIGNTGVRFMVTGDGHNETMAGLPANTGPNVNSVLEGGAKYTAATGANMVRFLGWTGKAVSSAGVNLGEWTDPTGTNNGGVVYGAVHNDGPDIGGKESFMYRMDRNIEELNARNIRIWMCTGSGKSQRIAAGLPPCTANGDSSVATEDGDKGMMWSDTWLSCYEDDIAWQLTRPNHITSVEYRNNPLISIYQVFNENSMMDAFASKSNTSGTAITTGVVFDAATKTITRTTGSFITDGLKLNMPATITGTVSNNIAITVANVTALVLTVNEAIVNETVVAGSVLLSTTLYAGDYIALSIGGTGSGPTGGSGWWLTELNATWNAWGATQSWWAGAGSAWPQASFPTRAQWYTNSNGLWPTVWKGRMIQFITAMEIAASLRVTAFVKSYAPNALVVYNETSYSTFNVSAYGGSDVSSIHNYGYLGGVTPGRPACTINNNGIEFAQHSQRHYLKPMVRSEDGQTTFSRNDFDQHCLSASIQCLQDSDGGINFCIWQNQFYSTTVGYATGAYSYTAIWPSRRLSQLFCRPIVKHRLIGPLPNTWNALVNDTSSLNETLTGNGQRCEIGEWMVGASSEWAWLQQKMSTRYSPTLPNDLSGLTNTLNDAAITAGITITSTNGTMFLRGCTSTTPNVAWEYPGVVGEMCHISDFTRGIVGKARLTVTGITGQTGRWLIAARSDGDWEIGQGNSLLCVHGAIFVSDMTVISSASAVPPSTTYNTYPANLNAFLAEDRVTVSGGTQAATGIVTPTALGISIANVPNHRVYGLTAAGLTATVTGTLIASSYDSGTQTLSFTTDPQYPAYHMQPINSTVISSASSSRNRYRGV